MRQLPSTAHGQGYRISPCAELAFCTADPLLWKTDSHSFRVGKRTRIAHVHVIHLCMLPGNAVVDK